MTARYVIVATRARDRWFDLDPVRTAYKPARGNARTVASNMRGDEHGRRSAGVADVDFTDGPGAPPLDWYLDDGVTPAPKERHMIGHAEFLLGDVREQLRALIAKGTLVDLVLSSPPFYNLRSYMDGDHPDKALEIGSEANPAEYLDTLLGLVALVDQVLAPHGSLVWELGDTYAGSGGAGGDYGEGGLRDGQPTFDGTASRTRADGNGKVSRGGERQRDKQGNGHPLDKSLIGIPTLFAWSLAYGRNLLTGEPSPAGKWRIRNVIPWCRPNPPVGALGDKWRPATSYVVVACRARDRWFDLDAVRLPASPNTSARTAKGAGRRDNTTAKASSGGNNHRDSLGIQDSDPAAGAPPLDWFLAEQSDDRYQWTDPAAEHSPDDGMWVIPTAPYKGAHYATWPPELVRRIVECMCPREVCRKCGRPRRRIVEATAMLDGQPLLQSVDASARDVGAALGFDHNRLSTERTTLGWTDCGHDDYRPGLVLDPFVGSGTTMAVAVRHGRDAIGIDLDARNIALARSRMGNLPLEAPTVAEEWDEGSLFGSPADPIEDVMGL